MYNSKDGTVDKDLTFLSYNQTINKEFTVEEILTSDLWVTNDDNGLIKAVPLFNCDKIVSSNSNDKVLDDNKCIILENINETLIQCISNDTGAIHYYSVELYAYTPYTSLDVIDEVTVYCILYDEYLNTLNNVDVDVYVDNVLVNTITTDSQGIAEFNVKEPCTIKFAYGETESDEITINE